MQALYDQQSKSFDAHDISSISNTGDGQHLRSNSKKSLSKNHSREGYLKYEDRNQLNTFET